MMMVKYHCYHTLYRVECPLHDVIVMIILHCNFASKIATFPSMLDVLVTGMASSV